MFLKLALRAARKRVHVLTVYFFFLPTKVLLKWSRSSIVFSNNTSSKIDGAGAQIQRLLGVYVLSRKFGIQFHQNSFTDISVHPLDPFQTKESKSDFIKQLNYLFAARGAISSKYNKVVEVDAVTAWSLFKIAALNSLRHDTILLNVIEPYPISDAFPNIFLDIRDSFQNWINFAQELAKDLPRPLISVHYRQGVGGSAIYPGQKISRELPPSYFLDKLRKKFGPQEIAFSVHLFTDAPLGDMVYNPDSEQYSHWQGTPGFVDGIMTIKGNDLYTFFTSNNVPVKVQSGGNPLDAMAIMSQSDLLITSRSSLSFVAGLLNSKGTVAAAEGFWHPSPRTWQKN